MKKQTVIRSALALAAATFSSRIGGFIRDALIFALLPRPVTDCFVVAFRLPNLFRRLVGEGSFAAAFVPAYVEARERSPSAARRLAGAVFAAVASAGLIVSMVLFVYMDRLITWLVGDPHGFAAVPGHLENTIFLARIMIFYLFLAVTYAFHSAAANAHGRFFLPALGPTLFNLAVIGFTLWPPAAWGTGAAPAYGVIAGGVLQAGVAAAVAARAGIRPRFNLAWRESGADRVFRDMLPGLIGVGFFQALILLNTMFAAWLPVGAQSHLYIADRILELPQALIGLSLGAALLPRLAELSAPARRSELVGETADALYAALFVILPAAVGLWALAGPITQILFMRGDFTAADAEAAAAVLTVYAPLLLFIGLARVIAPAFYALKRSGAPAFAALVILAAHVAAGWILAPRFGLPGLAAATVLSGGLNFVWLGWIFQRRVGALPWRRFAAGVSRLLPGLVVLALICRSGYPALLAIGAGRILALGLVMASAMLVYFTLSLAPFQYFSRSPAGSAAQLFPSWATFVCMRRKRPSKR